MARKIERTVILLIILVSILGSGAFFYSIIDNNLSEQAEQIQIGDKETVVEVKKRAKLPDSDSEGEYALWVDNNYQGTYSDAEGLKSYVAAQENSYVTLKGYGKPIFEHQKQYVVKTKHDTKQFGDINEALDFARENKGLESVVYFASNGKTIWSYDDKYKNNVSINVPVILQSPELVNGTEVTSLAMLLSAGGVTVDKQELAKLLAVDNTEKSEENGVITYGSPYYGYVGDMYSDVESYGVYNQPVFKLLQSYIYDYAVDLTGCKFSLIERFLDKGYPVWVMTTENFDVLPEKDFVTYNTNYGKVTVTTKSQAVLVTGYDSNFIYINDPKGNKSKVVRQKFEGSFEQMGSQAISYVAK